MPKEPVTSRTIMVFIVLWKETEIRIVMAQPMGKHAKDPREYVKSMQRNDIRKVDKLIANFSMLSLLLSRRAKKRGPIKHMNIPCEFWCGKIPPTWTLPSKYFIFVEMMKVIKMTAVSPFIKDSKSCVI